MDWFQCKCFGKLKAYSKAKKNNRILLRKACKFYLKSLFKKAIQSVKAYSLQPYKHFWFQKLKKHHIAISLKEETIKRKHEVSLIKEMFESWFWLQKEEENYFYLVESMEKFYSLRLKSKGLKGIISNKDKVNRKREIEHIIMLRKKKKFLRLWRLFLRIDRIKKLQKGKAYEHYYLSLLRKGFFEWMPCCRKIRQENENTLLKEKYFYFWKKLFVENEAQKDKALVLLRTRVIKKAFWKTWKLYIWFTKRLKISQKFYLYNRFLELKIATKQHRYLADQKNKAMLWYKWKKLKAYFEEFYVNYKKEKRISKEYKIKEYQFIKRREKRILSEHFKALTSALMMRHVEEVRGNRVLLKCFEKWLEVAFKQRIRRQKKQEFTKRMRLARLFRVFSCLKQDWINLKKKEFLAIQVWRYQRQRRFFKLLQAIMLYEWKERQMKSNEFYEKLLMQRSLYVLHCNKMAAQERRLMEEKIDWFIEKKIRKLLKQIMRNLFIWAKANVKYKGHQTSFLYKVFFHLKLKTKLKRLE